MILEDADEITVKYLPRNLSEEIRRGSLGSNESSQFRLPANGVLLDEVEMSLVRQAIERSGGNQTKAADMLGISRDQLRYRLKKLEEAAASLPA
jgi:DNA-binding NtrC family response regulator